MNTITIETFNASHDLYGNPTAHYIAWYNGAILATNQNGQREQIGYDGRINEAAKWQLSKLGFNLITDKKTLDRNGATEYKIETIDNEQDAFFVEVTDLFNGELNYSNLTRFKIYAKSERGAITKLAKYTGLNFRAYITNEVYHSKSKLTGATIEPFNFETHSQFEVTEL
jgi:hypothetical protein